MKIKCCVHLLISKAPQPEERRIGHLSNPSGVTRDSCKFHEACLACDRLDCEAWHEDQEEFSQCPGTAHWKQKKDMGAAGGNRKAGQHLCKPHTDFNNMLKKAKIKPTTEKVTRKRGAGV